MIETEAIILRAVKYRESSIIFDAYTEEHGLMGFIIGGVRRPKAKISAAMLQLGNMVDLVAYPSKSDLHRVKDVQLSYMYQRISKDVRRGAVLNFGIELFRNSVKEIERSAELYSLLYQFLHRLDSEESELYRMPIDFLLSLADPVGIRPDFSGAGLYFDLVAGTVSTDVPEHGSYIEDPHLQYLRDLRSGRREGQPALSRVDRQYVMDQMLRYYSYHLDGFRPLKSVDVLQMIF